MEISELKNIVEAALLAAPQPLSVNQLGELFGEEAPVTREDLLKALESLQADCDGRGVELVEVATGFRYQVRQSVYPWISKMWTERPSRYSRAMLETLALIAYRQPITRGEIEQVRGVVVSSNIIRTLEEREWIRVVGYRDVPGKPALFGTTRTFLDYFNIKSLDELPPLAAIRELDELDPQFDFDKPPEARASVPDTADATDTDDGDDAAAGAPSEPPAADTAANDASMPGRPEETAQAPSEPDADDSGADHPPRATADEAEARAEEPDTGTSAPNDSEENRA